MRIGPEVRKARTAMRLSQGAYAKRIGVTQAAVSKIEAGKTASVDGDTLVRMLLVGGLELTPRGPKARAA